MGRANSQQSKNKSNLPQVPKNLKKKLTVFTRNIQLNSQTVQTKKLRLEQKLPTSVRENHYSRKKQPVTDHPPLAFEWG